MTLKVVGLTKRYNFSTIINAWSRTFCSSNYALVGPNGIGKSTLIEILAGVTGFEEGSISLDDKNVMENPIWYKRQIGYCPDRMSFYPFLSLNDFFRLVSNIKKLPALNADNRLVREFGIGHDLNTRLEDLSLGTQKKALLVAAFIDNPRILLLDEPTDELDKHSQSFLVDLLRNRNKMTTIISTHDESLLEHLSIEVVSLG